MNLDNNLRSAVDAFRCDTIYPPKTIKKMLHRLQNQTERLKDSVKDLFLQQNNVEEENITRSLEEIKTDLVNCKKYIFNEEKKDLLKELKYISNNCTEILLDSNQIVGDDTKDDTNKYDELSLYRDKVSTEQTPAFKEIFIQVGAKLEKFKNKIVLQNTKSNVTDRIINNITHWFNKLISKETVSDEVDGSTNKDAHRINKYKTLLTALQDSRIKYDEANTYIKINLLRLQLTPLMTSYSEKIAQAKEYFESLNSSLKQISVPILAVGYHEFYERKIGVDENNKDVFCYKRDFTNLFAENGALTVYAQQQSQLTKNQEALDQLNLNGKQTLLTEIDKVIREISQEIDKINTNDNASSANEEREMVEIQNEEECITALNQEFNDSIDSSKKQLIKDFENLKNEIADKWNQCCLELNKVNHLKSMYTAFHKDNEGITACYYLAEHIHSTLRHQRKTQDVKDLHYTVIKHKIAEFKLLYNLITNLDQYNAEDCWMYDNNSSQLIKAFQDEGSALFVNLALSSLAMLDNSFENQCIFTSQEKEEAMNLALKNQQAEFQKEFNEQKESIDKACYTTLKKICEQAVHEIKTEVETLKWFKDDSSYDHCFTTSYFAKNRFGSALQTGASLVKYGATVTVNALVNKVQPKELEEFLVDNIDDPTSGLHEVASPFPKSL